MFNFNKISNNPLPGKIICAVVGHQWRYKDYSNWMKENGDNYDFVASRKCVFCKQNEYLKKSWERSEKKSIYDIIGDSHLMKKI